MESDSFFCGDSIQRELQKAVLKLPERQRLVFNMKYFDDMKYEDIAEDVECCGRHVEGNLSQRGKENRGKFENFRYFTLVRIVIGQVKRMVMDNLDEKYKSKNPFSVPDHYFETLGDRVMDRISEEEGATRKASLLQMLKPYLGLAALFVFAMIVVQLVVPDLVKEKRLLIKNNEEANIAVQTEEENIFDADFNPSREEIIEYLSQEADPIEFLYAERR